jgi:hypothetical protein
MFDNNDPSTKESDVRAGSGLMPFEFRELSPDQRRSLRHGIRFRILQGTVELASDVQPFLCRQIVDRHHPRLRDSENENSDVFVRCVEGSHLLVAGSSSEGMFSEVQARLYLNCEWAQVPLLQT